MIQEKQELNSQMCDNQKTRTLNKESRKNENQMQRMRLREFDKELFSYTGQLAWFLPGFFSFAALGLMCIPVQEIGREDSSLWMVVLVSCIWIPFLVLQPYVNVTDTFERPKNNRNRTYDKLKYLPVSRKQYIIVRMGYLFRYVWKLTLIGVAVQCLCAALSPGGVGLINVTYAAGVLMIMPLAAGWIQLRVGA